jgi:hypothetical protein
MHPGGGKEHGGIVFGQQGFALDLGMAFGFKEFYIFCTKFVGVHESMVA